MVVVKCCTVCSQPLIPVTTLEGDRFFHGWKDDCSVGKFYGRCYDFKVVVLDEGWFGKMVEEYGVPEYDLEECLVRLKFLEDKFCELESESARGVLDWFKALFGRKKE